MTAGRQIQADQHIYWDQFCWKCQRKKKGQDSLVVQRLTNPVDYIFLLLILPRPTCKQGEKKSPFLFV